MIKIISKRKYKDLKQENYLLNIELRNTNRDYSFLTFTQLRDVRKELVSDVKVIDKRIREMYESFSKTTGKDKRTFNKLR